MSSSTDFEQRLASLWGELSDLSRASNLLEWDQETHMPGKGLEGRGAVLGTLAGLHHRLLVAPELSDALDACAEVAQPGSRLAAQVARARHSVDRAVRVDEALARSLALAQSRGTSAWQAARAANDFEAFTPALTELLSLKREQAAAIRPNGGAYDAMLDGFEPGATEAWLEPLFERLEGTLAPRVRALTARSAVDESPALGSFPAAAQAAFGRQMATAIGFDFEAGRLDETAHPFCVGVNPGDVRLTWRWYEEDFRPGLFGILHEAGHGLYEQGLPTDQQRLPIGGAVSLGIHESQSRLWENHVGRSRGFWQWAKPHFERAFPAAGPLDVDALWPALHTAKPTFIRVDADEATYNLHVAIRFGLERRLFSGELEVPDLPAVWDEAYGSLLGIRPSGPAEGVLQDIHWAHGLFGYFPTYTLGTMAAAQLFSAASRDLGDLDAAFAAGDFHPLLDWLRTNIHVHGARFGAPELIERATGQPLTADHLVDYLKETTERAYPA